MAYAFVNGSFAGDASGSAVTVNRPASTVDGHLLWVVAYLEPDTATWTPGTGFTSAYTQANTGRFLLQAWWKWAASEPASWTWTPSASGWRTVVCVAYSGGSGSGNPVDVSGGAQADAVIKTSQTAPSVTTTAANDLLIYSYGNFSGNSITTMAGATTNMRVSFGGVTIADATIATASATGTTNPDTGTIGTEDYAAFHVGLFLSSGSASLITDARQPRGLERGYARGHV